MIDLFVLPKKLIGEPSLLRYFFLDELRLISDESYEEEAF